MADRMWSGVKAVSRRSVARAMVLCLLAALWGMAFGEDTRAPQLKIVAPNIPGTSEPGERGRDVEVVAAVFNQCGWAPDFVYLPSGRHLLAYDDLPSVDGAMTVPVSLPMEGFSTASYVSYWNGAFYNASKVGPIETIDDLQGLRAVTFRDGIRVLGLAERASDFELLMEIPDQALHAKMQLMGRIDVILADGFAIASLAERIQAEQRPGKIWPQEGDVFVFSPIFPPTPYKMVFRQSAMAARFDRCLEQVKAKGIIDDINKKHVDWYQRVLRVLAPSGKEVPLSTDQ